VLSNLISNGCKFTPPGGQVTVRMATSCHALPALLEPPHHGTTATTDTTTDSSPTQGVVRFSVTDSGPGVALDAQARLFQQFHVLRDHAQQEPAAADVDGGGAASTGIGLWYNMHRTLPSPNPLTAYSRAYIIL
jgi:signal transduction histidine kinase